MEERELEEAMKRLAKSMTRKRRTLKLMLLGAIVGAPAMPDEFHGR